MTRPAAPRWRRPPRRATSSPAGPARATTAETRDLAPRAVTASGAPVPP
ncbi:hypothetical protein OZK63_36915 [Streptomyces sp. UMAF16]|nr:hypothetical protein [Streptomyces sp. UMAF16]